MDSEVEKWCIMDTVKCQVVHYGYSEVSSGALWIVQLNSGALWTVQLKVVRYG